MKKTFYAATIVFLIIALTGCGGGGSSAPPTFTTQILSDPTVDGDIAKDVAGTVTITQTNTQSVFAGIDPSTGTEYRAFLDFPLGGQGGVPGNAFIVSATLDLVINNIQPPAGTIPIRIELVSLPGLVLAADDFSRTLLPALAFTTIVPPISSADVGNHVPVDVTSLMIMAQNSGQPDFQVRILEDLGLVSPGLIEINDTTSSITNRGLLAPLLTVTYQ